MGAAKHLSTLTRRNVRSSADTLIGPEVILCGAGGHTLLALRNTFLFSFFPSQCQRMARGLNGWHGARALLRAMAVRSSGNDTVWVSVPGTPTTKHETATRITATAAVRDSLSFFLSLSISLSFSLYLSLFLSLFNTSIHFPFSTHSQWIVNVYSKTECRSTSTYRRLRHASLCCRDKGMLMSSFCSCVFCRLRVLFFNRYFYFSVS